MKGKTERQRIIREVVRENRIASQEELAAILEKRGLDVAQATLSRDIKDLKISKLHDETGYYYSLSRPSSTRSIETTINSSESIECIEFSSNVAVIKTRPGHANMVAVIIDTGSIKEIAGTIAGDDTILVVIREGYTKNDILKSLGKIFRQLESKRIN